MNENEIYFTLADVSGKGVKAGILMANAAAVFRSMAKLEKPVSTIAKFVNNQVAYSSYQGMFITAVIGKFNLKDKSIEYINLGHEPIMIFDKDYNFEYLKSTLPPLGLMHMDDDGFFQTSKIDINNKNLMIYTDGVTEGYLEDGSELEVKGLEKELKENKLVKTTEIITHISHLLTKRNKPLRDDVTCLIISGHQKLNEKILFILLIFNIFNFAKAEVTYLEILKNPTDLKLNLQYAKEQENKVRLKM